MANNFTGKLEGRFHPFCNENCPCLKVYGDKESFWAGSEEIVASNYVTCENYSFCKDFVPAIRDDRVDINAVSVSNVDTKQ